MSKLINNLLEKVKDHPLDLQSLEVISMYHSETGFLEITEILKRNKRSKWQCQNPNVCSLKKLCLVVLMSSPFVTIIYLRLAKQRTFNDKDCLDR